MAQKELNKEKLVSKKVSFSTVVEAVEEALYESGVKVVYNYPGRPASYLIDKLKEKSKVDIQEYLPNEYVAAGKGFGSSVAGCERSMVVFKDVGVNVASDHLYCLNHVGINRGLVFFIADDPSAWHSQNEEDSRMIYFGAGLPILEPFDANCSYYSVKTAYELSEIIRLPIFIRTTARALNETFLPNNDLSNVEIPFAKDFVDIPFDAKNRWLSIFSTVEEDKEELYKKQAELAKCFDESKLNVVKGHGDLGVIASGFIATQLENENLIDSEMSLLKLTTVFPLPEKTILDFVSDKKRILVIDQGEPLLEMLVRDVLYRHGCKVQVVGKLDGFVRGVGEFRDDDLKISAKAFKENAKPKEFPKHKKIAKAPAFGPTEPYRIMVESVRDAVKEVGVRPLYVGDAGQPSRIPDTPDLEDCLHLETTMGGVASYLSGGIEAYKRQGKEVPFKGIAYTGDSDFFHSSFSGICEVAVKDHPILLLIADNQGAVSTGKQPHLGMYIKDGIKQISIKKVLEAVGVDHLEEADVKNKDDLKSKIIKGLKSNHFYVIIVHL